jgi:hypothetical protein
VGHLDEDEEILMVSFQGRIVTIRKAKARYRKTKRAAALSCDRPDGSVAKTEAD